MTAQGKLMETAGAVMIALLVIIAISAPLLAIGFIAGIVISLVQVVTSIQDSAFNAIPRLIAFLGGCLVMMPWMVHKSMAYTIDILGNLSRYGR